MSEVSLDAFANLQVSFDAHGSNVGTPVARNTRPRVVMLESGVKALIEVVGLANVESAVDAILVDAKNIDSSDGIVSRT